MKRSRNGRFTSETAVRRAAVSEVKRPPGSGSRSGLKTPLGLLESSMYNSFQGGDDGCGYRNMYKTLRGLVCAKAKL
jgi:hypothetical protein